MATRKSPSNVEIYVDLFANLFSDLSFHYPELIKTFKDDMRVLRQRTASEGISFLTKTMPKLGKAFDRMMETGRLEIPKEFKKHHANRTIPAFLQGMFSCLDGHIGDPDPYYAEIVNDIRQVLFFAYKLELPYSVVQEASVVESFKATERELGALHFDSDLPLLRAARLVVKCALKGFDPRNGLPRHGPGAVSTGEKLEEKWVFKRLFDSIHQRFPYYDYFISGGARELADRIHWYRSLERVPTGTAKVVLVPKDSRGPRLISCEPLEYQYMQQMIGRELVDHLERRSTCKGQINFTDQSVNQKLALQGSVSGDFATLDMKDASDRVDCRLVEAIFPTEVVKDLMAVRTTATKLPDGTVLPLRKFAPMGSALCFPVEALCFWSLAVAAIAEYTRLPIRTCIKFYGKQVFVYGDDIIVPTRFACLVMERLETVGLLFNRAKCFTTGPFRESCGMDAYMGVQVAPHRLRTPWSGKRSDGKAYASYLELANLLQKRYTRASLAVLDLLTNCYGKIPYAGPRSAFPGYAAGSTLDASMLNSMDGFKTRYNAQTQHVEIRVRILKAKKTDSTLDGWGRLLRNLLVPVGDESRVAHPNSAQLTVGWRRLI